MGSHPASSLPRGLSSRSWCHSDPCPAATLPALGLGVPQGPHAEGRGQATHARGWWGSGTGVRASSYRRGGGIGLRRSQLGLEWEPALELTPPAVCPNSLDCPAPMEERRWRLGERGLCSFSALTLRSHSGPCGCGQAAPPPAAETPPEPGRAFSHDFSSTPSPPPSLLLAPLGSAAPPRSLLGRPYRGMCSVGRAREGSSAAILPRAARSGPAGCSRDD